MVDFAAKVGEVELCPWLASAGATDTPGIVTVGLVADWLCAAPFGLTALFVARAGWVELCP